MTTTPQAPTESGLPSDALLTAEERAAWTAFNGRTRPWPEGPALIRRLEETAARRAEEPAVQADDGTYTYRELHAEADRIAGALAAQGVTAGGTVAVAATRRRGDYAALLAALKLDCAYLPLATDGPARRLEFTLADSSAVALVADAPAAALLAAAGIGTGLAARVVTGAGHDAPAGWTTSHTAPQGARPPGQPAGQPSGDRTSYVIYTSGSTGTPKGVMTGEEALLNFCAWYVERHEVLPHDRLCQTAPLTFDPSVQQLFPAWLTGACLVVVPDEVQREGGEFLDWLAAERITHLDIVTPHWVQLLDVAAQRGGAALPALRWIVVGGETYFFHQTHRWHRAVDSPARLNTIYGPTEATVNATEFLVEPGVTEGQVPIGQPLPNYRAYVLDEHGALCPPDITGELYLAGTGLARRYCSAEATARSFRELTVSEGTTERLYRTGDLARLIDHDGTWVLEFQGRTDSQVKVSGYRIELEEIQAALAGIPGVTAGAVVLRTEPAKQIVCGYVAAGLTEDRIRTELAERLPAYMVPHLIAPVPAVPLTANGKVAKDALLALVVERHDSAKAGGTEPQGPVETAIAAAWAEVLGVPRVGADEDFFGHGGSSLLAFRVVALLREKGVTLRAADLLQARTVRALAERATTGGTSGATSHAPTGGLSGPAGHETAAGGRDDRGEGGGEGGDSGTPLLPEPRHELADDPGRALDLPPATSLALLGGDTEDVGDHAVLTLGLPRDIDPEAVRRALAEVVARHPMLRARLDTGQARLRLRALRVVHFDLPVLDGDSLTLVDRVRPLLTARTGLRRGLPVSAALLRLPTGAKLLLAVRHLLVDGNALRRITAELAAELGLGAPPAAPVPLAEQLAELSGQARAMRPVAHLNAFMEAERQAQRRLAPRLTPHGTVTEVDAGELPAPLTGGAPGEWEPRLVAAAALAVHRWLGLPTVPLSLPRQAGAGDAVANLSDVVPLLVTPDDGTDGTNGTNGANGGAAGALRSAAAGWAEHADPAAHWSAALLMHCPGLAGNWPGRREPLTGSFLIAVEPEADRTGRGTAVPGTGGRLTEHDSPTAPDPALSGAVQFTCVADAARPALRLIGWDLPEAALRELVPLWRTALAEVAGAGPAGGGAA
ncbi:amino acid adenylation domain-containing protein [Streptomyces venezuelae]|uniref:amino acid adenylation domain-containing protein n=1 Tax=Streptomyces venezuelae TaxID=54571 RepID=UPI00168024C7|nr:amino acid adenylation domain-containing protein [Streptomyces venezuelae]